MAFEQKEFDRMIVVRNKNESMLSPLKYTPIFQDDPFYKLKLHGNRDNYLGKSNNLNEVKNPIRQIASDNYWDIQNKYIKEPNNATSEEHLNHIMGRKLAEESRLTPIITKNYGEETQSERSLPKSGIINAGTLISSHSQGNYNREWIPRSVNFNNSLQSPQISSTSNQIPPVTHYGKLNTEYSKYVKYDNPQPRTDEYMQNKFLGYGRNLIASPNKDYAKFFLKRD